MTPVSREAMLFVEPKRFSALNPAEFADIGWSLCNTQLFWLSIRNVLYSSQCRGGEVGGRGICSLDFGIDRTAALMLQGFDRCKHVLVQWPHLLDQHKGVTVGDDNICVCVV